VLEVLEVLDQEMLDADVLHAENAETSDHCFDLLTLNCNINILARKNNTFIILI
jgi:hypothetical protein